MADLNRTELETLLELGLQLKAEAREGTLEPALTRKVVGLLFEKPSTRTRVSFEAPA